MFPQKTHVLKTWAPVAGVIWEVVITLQGGIYLEEVGHWGCLWGQYFVLDPFLFFACFLSAMR
jgi:hypothetical protein